MPSTFDQHMETALACLHAARSALQDEIAQYPAPISGCDAQFNHLLAERQRVANALKAMSDPVFVATPRTPDPAAGVESR